METVTYQPQKGVFRTLAPYYPLDRIGLIDFKCPGCNFERKASVFKTTGTPPAPYTFIDGGSCLSCGGWLSVRIKPGHTFPETPIDGMELEIEVTGPLESL